MTTNAEYQAAYRQRVKDGTPFAPKACGTVAAVRRHQRAGEPLCALCRPVWADYQAATYRRGKGKP